MFTGIVEELGEVTEITRPGEGQDARLSIKSPLVLSDAQYGHSISVNGVCLTIANMDGETWTADVMPETLSRSALGDLTAGAQVNLERAVAVQSRLGGHIVQGHVDTVAHLRQRTEGARWHDLDFDLPQEFTRYIVEKGSITVSGVSLTVTKVSESSFSVSLIPTTLEHTTLGQLQPGSPVNIELDIIAKYVERLLLPQETSGKHARTLTEDTDGLETPPQTDSDLDTSGKALS